MALQADHTLRGSRTPSPSRSRLPSGQLRAPGRTYADDPRPTLAELAGTPLDFLDGQRDLPCQQPDRIRWWFAPEEEPGMPKLDERHASAAQGECRSCPLLLECRRYALRNRSIQHGIWGGVRFVGMHINTRAALLKETEQQLAARRRAAS